MDDWKSELRAVIQKQQRKAAKAGTQQAVEYRDAVRYIRKTILPAFQDFKALAELEGWSTIVEMPEHQEGHAPSIRLVVTSVGGFEWSYEAEVASSPKGPTVKVVSDIGPRGLQEAQARLCLTDALIEPPPTKDGMLQLLVEAARVAVDWPQ